jgi:NAD(P)-dependent dehydrogenase (short-subunit alcohol dehydrogenase family)
MNVSSMVGRVPMSDFGGYCARKYVVRGLTAYMHEALIHHGIKVTAICPSAIDIDMRAGFEVANHKKFRCETWLAR